MKRALLAAVLSLAACAGKQHGAQANAELRVVAQPEGAVVQVNEQFVGSARVLAKRPARFTPGKKRVTVEAPGYFPHDVEVDLAKGVTTIDIKLRPIPK